MMNTLLLGLLILSAFIWVVTFLVKRLISSTLKSAFSQPEPRLTNPEELQELAAIHTRLQRLADRAENAGDRGGAKYVRNAAVKLMLVPTIYNARARETEIQSQMERRFQMSQRDREMMDFDDSLRMEAASTRSTFSSQSSSESDDTDDWDSDTDTDTESDTGTSSSSSSVFSGSSSSSRSDNS